MKRSTPGFFQRLDRTKLDGITTRRLSVWPPAAKGPPHSFAVAAAPRWKKAGPGLPLDLKWKRAAASRWELTFRLPAEAVCIGLGENCTHHLDLRNRVWTLLATDDPIHVETMEAMYKSIPFLMVVDRGRAIGLFLDSPAVQRWDLDSSLSGGAGVDLLSRRGWSLYVFGPAPVPDIVRAYTSLTGRAWLPPAWSLGHQQSRWSYGDQNTVLGLAREFRRRRIPCDTLVLDVDYMDGYRVFTHSKKAFPQFRKMVGRLRRQGFRVVTIVDPGVKKDPRYRLYEEGRRRDLFCRTSAGKLFIDQVWPGDAAFPDFLRREVRQWWAGHQSFYLDNGVSGIWNDMNEPAMFKHMRVLSPEARELPPDSQQIFMQGTPEGPAGHLEVRNLYGFQMCRATHEGLRKLRPNERPFVLTRSAYAGIQRYSAVWLGDNMSWFDHLAKSVPMLVNMGLSGTPFCGVDIGGFGADATPELLLRWYAVGIFYPFFRNHCAIAKRHQEPWVFGRRTEGWCRRFIETRYRLLPYIQSLFWEHLRTGAPLMRPLFWHHPDDARAARVDDQFLFGRDLLVAPVLQRAKRSRMVYFPRGRWHRWDTGEVFAGGCHREVDLGLGDVPVFVRDGAILPLADVVQSTDRLDRAAVTFACFGKTAGGRYFEDDGRSFDYERGIYGEWAVKLSAGRISVRRIHGNQHASRRRYFWSKGMGPRRPLKPLQAR